MSLLAVVLGVIVVLVVVFLFIHFKDKSASLNNVKEALVAIENIFKDKFGNKSGMVFSFFLNAFQKIIAENVTEDEAVNEFVNLVTVAAHVANVPLTDGELAIIRNVAKLFLEKLGVKFFSPANVKETSMYQTAIESVKK